ncbi:MAG: RluA family pseudouridine synthase [Acidimicrobiales bacterium]|nr:RluA family pseudouridine synthase [Acidimicrobiales bacterium]
MDDILVIQIPPSLDGERVDRAITTLIDVTRSEASELVNSGQVSVDGQIVLKPSFRLKHDQVLEFPDHSQKDEIPIEPDSSVVFDVVYEDSDLLVIDKPPGLVVHPGSGNLSGTLVSGLISRYPEIEHVGEVSRPGIVHRLDKGTSGLMIVARSGLAYEKLSLAIAKRSVERRYLALVEGKVSGELGRIEGPIGRSLKDPTKMAVVMMGKEAATNYEVKNRLSDPFVASYLDVKLETGRTHQIRVHFSSIGNPVVGDLRYGQSLAKFSIALERPFLHAYSLALNHPISSDPLEFRSNIPTDLQEVLDLFS